MPFRGLVPVGMDLRVSDYSWMKKQNYFPFQPAELEKGNKLWRRFAQPCRKNKTKQKFKLTSL